MVVVTEQGESWPLTATLVQVWRYRTSTCGGVMRIFYTTMHCMECTVCLCGYFCHLYDAWHNPCEIRKVTPELLL